MPPSFRFFQKVTWETKMSDETSKGILIVDELFIEIENSNRHRVNLISLFFYTKWFQKSLKGFSYYLKIEQRLSCSYKISLILQIKTINVQKIIRVIFHKKKKKVNGIVVIPRLSLKVFSNKEKVNLYPSVKDKMIKQMRTEKKN